MPSLSPEKKPVKVLPPRVDKNQQRVFELEKEVFELYKMLDYWKNEAKTQELRGAEENSHLRSRLNGTLVYTALTRVVNRHASRGFEAFKRVE